jgi:hypothetical protein
VIRLVLGFPLQVRVNPFLQGVERVELADFLREVVVDRQKLLFGAV